MWRFRFTFALFVLAFLTVVARLFYWQVVKAEELAQLGREQYGRTLTVKPNRGDIKGRDDFPMATKKLVYIAFANPKEIPNTQHVAITRTLASLLDQDEASIAAALKRDLFWVPLAPSVDPLTKERVVQQKLPGIGFEERSLRFYPEASMAAHLLGFVGKDELGEDKGYFGLEGYYDRQLRGKEGRGVVIYDALGRPVVARLSRVGQVDGRTLILSVERAIQFTLEKKLRQGIEKYAASGGMAAVMNPKTGEILAMASFPSFDPGRYSAYEESTFKNPFISSVYEPGSTFKTLVMASALDAEVVEPETTCPTCEGPITIGGYTIRTWNDKYYPNTTMIDVIQHSNNTGMVFVGKKLGLDRLLVYLRNFGIGELTSIDVQGEVQAPLRPADEWYPIDLATASFGQGISVTPLQLLTAFSAIANSGKRMEPHVVTEIQTTDGQIIPIQPKVVSQPISSKTAKVMTEVLVNAVNKGEAKFARLKGYRIAGKTGTAQIPIAGHYDPNKTIASFIGFAPADDPKFSMFVIIDRPTTSPFGSETAAPIFFDIAKDILSYYGILPTESE